MAVCGCGGSARSMRIWVAEQAVWRRVDRDAPKNGWLALALQIALAVNPGGIGHMTEQWVLPRSR